MADNFTDKDRMGDPLPDLGQDFVDIQGDTGDVSVGSLVGEPMGTDRKSWHDDPSSTDDLVTISGTASEATSDGDGASPVDKTARVSHPEESPRRKHGRRKRGHREEHPQAYPEVMNASYAPYEGDSANVPRHGATKDKGSKAKAGFPLAGKIAIGIVVFLIVALLAVWLWGRDRYSKVLFPGVTVDGIAVGGMTPVEARAATDVKNWSFDVVDRTSTYHLGAEDVGFETEEVDYEKLLADQDVNLWFVHVISPQPNDTVRVSTYDSDKLHGAVYALPCVSGNRTKPEDAKAERAQDGLSFKVVKEIEGDQVKSVVIEQAVEDALAEGRSGSIDLEKADAYMRPLVYSTDKNLTEAVEKANRWMSTRVTYDIDGLESVEEIGPETIAPWVNIVRNDPQESEAKGATSTEQEQKVDRGEDATADGTQGGTKLIFGRRAQAGQPGEGSFHLIADGKTKPGDKAEGSTEPERAMPTWTVTFDDDALRGWLAHIGEEYDTAGKPRTITTPTGKVANISGGGSYGWITDEGTEFEALKADIEEGNTTHREFAMKQRAALPKGQNEWGNTYVEIDLSAQHLWYISGGEVVLSYGVITGKSGYETPAMVSEVYNKVTDIVLISPWKDPVTGEPTYKTHIDVGLTISSDGGILCHDAPWQPGYGFGDPDYHWSGGSHGCCNMRASDCWALYENVAVGTPVIVHY